MSKATMSIRGLYQYDSTIFDGLTLPEEMDKDILINELLRQCAELEILYPDPDFMKDSLSSWSQMNAVKWEKLYATVKAEYDPIENYNRIEEAEETATPDLQTTTAVSAFNTDKFRDASSVKSEGTNTVKRSSHIHGNIGVTTSQQMLEAERKLQDWSIYQFIIDSFKLEYCLLVY